ncbi:MAG: DUF4230 domain-containing protein [Lachnospiraceae bacterium]|nr:DUF4230 domain-containing protein [Lachnospiraceae bacterium]
MENKELKQKKNSTLKFIINHPKIIFIILIGMVAILVAIGVREYISYDAKTTKIGFEDIGELATQAAYCTEIGTIDNPRELGTIKIPFTQSKYIYSYDIIIKAGFDFEEIEWGEDDENKIIKVTLPKARVLSREINLDSFKVYHEDESIFNRITLEENNEEIKKLEQEAEKTAIENGLLKNARQNAKTILKSFFGKEYDLEEWRVKFY